MQLFKETQRLLLGSNVAGDGVKNLRFAPELAGELLRPFTIADVRHHAGGTGLNLALASAIVKAHGGQIRAESPGVGQGATFTVELPLAKD